MGITNNKLKWHLDLNVFMTPIAHTNWSTNTVDANAVYRGYRASSGAQNDSVTFWPTLAKGTWTILLMYRKNTANGIVSVRFDGAEQGTIDTYAAAPALNNVTPISGLVVAEAGKIVLTLVMATKHASASNYAGEIQHIQFQRTA